MFEHIVLFRLHPKTDVERARLILESSRPEAGVVEWSVAESLDRRKGVVLVERAVFTDRASFERFQEMPAHRCAGEHMSTCSDWLIGDVEHAPEASSRIAE